MPRKHKPGPKSRTQTKINTQCGSLGEETETSDDASSTLRQADGKSKDKSSNIGNERQGTANNREEFRSPEVDENVTDYGLEFTNDIQRLSPRRCSTFRRPVTPQQKPQSSGTAKRTVGKRSTFPRPVSPEQEPQSSGTAKRTAERHPRKAKNTDAATSSSRPANVINRRRKQLHPLHKEKRFWAEVKVLRNRTDNLIPLLPFGRLVRQIMNETSTEVTRITLTALEALQTSTEMYTAQRLQDAYMLTLHRGRVTLEVRDLEILKYLKLDVL